MSVSMMMGNGAASRRHASHHIVRSTSGAPANERGARDGAQVAKLARSWQRGWRSHEALGSMQPDEGFAGFDSDEGLAPAYSTPAYSTPTPAGAPPADRPMHSVALEPLDDEVSSLPPMVPQARAQKKGEHEAAMLMAGERGAAGVTLVEWARYARPVEAALLGVCLVLIVSALTGGEWLYGANEKLLPVSAGLYSVHAGAELEKSTGIGRAALACDPELAPEGSVVCSLTRAGGAAGGFVVASLLAALCLGGCFAAEELDKRGRLAAVRAKLPPNLPLAKLGRLPLGLWGALGGLTYAALLTYALKAPATMGGAMSHLGATYGLGRLTLLLSLCGLAVHVTLVLRVGEDHVINVLDTLSGQWAHMAPRQKAVQAMLGAGLACELLLWVERVEWGALLLVYGLYSHSHNAAEHLSLFCAVAVLSVLTDGLTLAADSHGGAFTPAVTWALLVCKAGSVGSLVYHRDAFA